MTDRIPLRCSGCKGQDHYISVLGAGKNETGHPAHFFLSDGQVEANAPSLPSDVEYNSTTWVCTTCGEVGSNSFEPAE